MKAKYTFDMVVSNTLISIKNWMLKVLSLFLVQR